MKKTADRIIEWLRRKAKEARAKGFVFGISGGVDSALVGALCKKAFPRNCLGLIIPCFSLKEDIKDARILARKFRIPVKTIDLSKIYTQYTKLLGAGNPVLSKKNLALGNIKPRLRMMTLYYFANKNNYLVIGTGNKSEAVMGYFTKYGDGGVDLLPLGDLTKTKVRRLAEELGVPEKIIKKAPTAGLWKGQTDEGEMGITYQQLDRIIEGLEKGMLKGLDRKLVNKVKNRMARTEHKRRLPEIFKS